MSAAEADEIYALRLALEPAAAAFAAVHAGDAEREEVQRVFERLDAAASDNLADVAVRNRDFHTAPVRVGGRLLTTQMVQRLSILRSDERGGGKGCVGTCRSGWGAN